MVLLDTPVPLWNRKHAPGWRKQASSGAACAPSAASFRPGPAGERVQRLGDVLAALSAVVLS